MYRLIVGNHFLGKTGEIRRGATEQTTYLSRCTQQARGALKESVGSLNRTCSPGGHGKQRWGMLGLGRDCGSFLFLCYHTGGLRHRSKLARTHIAAQAQEGSGGRLPFRDPRMYHLPSVYSTSGARVIESHPSLQGGGACTPVSSSSISGRRLLARPFLPSSPVWKLTTVDWT